MYENTGSFRMLTIHYLMLPFTLHSSFKPPLHKQQSMRCMAEIIITVLTKIFLVKAVIFAPVSCIT